MAELSSFTKTVNGLIGNDFMHRQEWIIDFVGRKISEKLECIC